MTKAKYRHRCYCCVGRTQHVSGPCLTCGSKGYLKSPKQTLSQPEFDNHRSIILGGLGCKLTEVETQDALDFVSAGEPNTWEPE